MSKYSQQIELEKLLNKNQLVDRIRVEFINCEQFSFQDYLIEQEIPVDFGIDVLVQMAIHRRCGVSTLVGILRKYCDNLQLITDLLDKCVSANLLNWDDQFKVFNVAFPITAEVQAEIDQYQFPLPMLIEPKQITKNNQTGYETIKGSLLLKNNYHTNDICLDHINRANKVKLTINNQTATMVKNQWRNLDKPKKDESHEDFMKRKKAFEKYDRTVKVVHEIMNATGNEFHLTHRYDFRGRVYAHGYHINPQGHDYQKAVIEFHDKEFIHD